MVVQQPLPPRGVNLVCKVQSKRFMSKTENYELCINDGIIYLRVPSIAVSYIDFQPT